MVFNNPAMCTGGACDDDDIYLDGDPEAGLNAEQIAATRMSVVWAQTGDVANPGGRLKLDSGVAEGEVPGVPTRSPSVSMSTIQPCPSR